MIHDCYPREFGYDPGTKWDRMDTSTAQSQSAAAQRSRHVLQSCVVSRPGESDNVHLMEELEKLNNRTELIKTRQLWQTCLGAQYACVVRQEYRDLPNDLEWTYHSVYASTMLRILAGTATAVHLFAVRYMLNVHACNVF